MIWDPDYKSKEDGYEDPEEKELRTFYSKAWSTRCDPVALTEFMSAVKNYPYKKVMRALRKIFREQERSVRPSIKQVLANVYEINNQDRMANAESLAGPDCTWCNGRKVYYVFVYPVHSAELPFDFIPNEAQKKIMRQQSKNWWLVKPAAAKKKGMVPREERLWCHNCQSAGDSPGSYYAPGYSVSEFIGKFDSYVDWDRTGPRELIDRLFDANPAPERILSQKELTAVLKELKSEKLVQEVGPDIDTIQSEDFGQDVAEIAGPSGSDRDRSGPADES